MDKKDYKILSERMAELTHMNLEAMPKLLEFKENNL